MAGIGIKGYDQILGRVQNDGYNPSGKKDKAKKSNNVYNPSKLFAARNALQNRLNSFQSPQALQAESLRKEKVGSIPQFEALRKRLTTQLEQRSRANEQEAQDALQRRLVSTGALNSGAGIKMLSKQQTESQRARENQLSDLDAELSFGEEQEKQRRLERIQDLNEQTKSRNFQRELSNMDQQFRSQVFQFDAQSKLAGLDFQIEQFKTDREDAEFNKRLARYEAGRSGGLFGGGGFLGLGLGAKDADI